MTKRARKTIVYTILFSLLLIVIDQIIKIWVKTNMVEHQMYSITSWFKIYFIENEGMAYGITLGSKLFLTFFRIIAMSFIAYFIIKIIKLRDWPKGFLISLSLIFAGGWGNIIDSIFYGSVFSSSIDSVAHWVGFGNGYGKLFYGYVVDMFYFPIIDVVLPSWIPFWGGRPYIFFSPIFNFADACISVGVVMMVIFYYRSMGMAFDIISKKSSKIANYKK